MEFGVWGFGFGFETSGTSMTEMESVSGLG